MVTCQLIQVILTMAITFFIPRGEVTAKAMVDDAQISSREQEREGNRST